jgi:hypothetical protein
MTIDFKQEFGNLKLPPSGATPSWFQKRGYKFETLLNGVLKQEQLLPRTSYKTQGEQIDGSFIYNGKAFLLEAKWHKDELPASSIYAFKGKVDGKLIGTIGIYISVSGYLPDTIDALSLGKTINVLLFDGNDMVAVVNPKIGFRKVLEFKLRAAAEEGIVFAPFDLVSAVSSPIPFYIICEGTTDKMILETINHRLGQLDNKDYQHIEIIPAGGAYNLPKIANSLKSLLPDNARVLMIADSDGGTNPAIKFINEQVSFSNWALVLPEPFIESWLFENLDEFSEIRKRHSRAKMLEVIQEKALSLNIEKFAEKDKEFRKYIKEIRASNGG